MAKFKQYLQRIFAYLLFRLRAKSLKGHGIHSPFVFHLVTEVLQKHPDEHSLHTIEQLRDKLSLDKRTIQLNDLGAGNWKNTPRVKEILKKSVSSSKKCRFFFQISKELNPNQIIELGTSLGLSALTFAVACPHAQVITVEGSAELANIAIENFKKIGVSNIDLKIGSFDDLLPKIIPLIKQPFIAYIDGNHRYNSTLKYFNVFVEQLDCQSCIIIDDIHWSKDMEKAWNAICQHSKSTICLDFYEFGIVFYRKNTAKTSYSIHY
ncbi:MAG: class I SAM-dependent methyltransferase [Bacteroidales bacterium]|nr:class I SAM-dependent methyltransferase [Bacteroidales bacterium]